MKRHMLPALIQAACCCKLQPSKAGGFTHLLGVLCDGTQQRDNVDDLESALLALQNGLLAGDEQCWKATCVQ